LIIHHEEVNVRRVMDVEPQ